ncbi:MULTISPECIES: glycosyltransferase [unclassified Blastococcus]
MLWAIKGLGAGGAERLLVSLARVADRQQFEFEVAYVLPHKTAFVPMLADAGVVSHCLTPAAPARALGRLAWIGGLRRLMAVGGYDVVHTHSPLVAGVARLVRLTIPARRRPAAVSTEHNSWSSYRPGTRWLNAVLHRRDSLRFAVSAEVRDSMWRPWRKGVEVLAHGVVLDDYASARSRREEVRRRLGIAPGTVVVLTVANLRREKGYPELLEAASTILRSGRDVLFLAAGQGALADAFRRRHGELHLGDRFRFLGQVDDVAGLLAAADVFTLPSRFEGKPVALMEALCVGLPVVATRVGGIPEQVTDGVEGLLVPPGDPEALVAALVALIEDGGLRRRLGAAALRRGRDFDIRRAGRRLERGYARVAGSRRGPG